MTDTENKWTPGPWSVDFGEATRVRDDSGGAVATVCYTGHGGKFGGRRPLNEPEANASLISAAPELYEALEGATHELEMSLSAETFNAALHNAKAALAKARGGQP